MSGSDSDDGGPGLEGILWGNLGKDGLELDYMDEVRACRGLGCGLRCWRLMLCS